MRELPIAPPDVYESELPIPVVAVVVSLLIYPASGHRKCLGSIINYN